jgi:hypothetical protein
VLDKQHAGRGSKKARPLIPACRWAGGELALGLAQAGSA